MEMPLFLYNIPSNQGYNVAPKESGKISERVPQVAGIRGTSYNIEQMEILVHKFGKDHLIIGAGDSIIFPIFAVGAKAHISVISNVFPETTLQIYREFKKSNYEKARNLQFLLNEVREVFKEGPYITTYKEAVRMLYKIDLGTVSSPLRAMTENEVNEFGRELKKIEKKLSAQ